MNPGRLFYAAANRVSDCLFPERCIVCGAYIQFSRREYSLCAACEESLCVTEERRCRICSRPLISERELCRECRDREFRFESNFSLFMYQEPFVARLIAAYKGQGRRSLAAFFAERLLRAYHVRYEGLPLVPVPCRKASLRKRGFDHIALLCKEMKRRARLEVLPLLLRRGQGREQKTLNREERGKNLRGLIVPAKRALARLKDVPPEVILLDDVFTTGATAGECAETLKSLGIQKVRVLTIAID